MKGAKAVVRGRTAVRLVAWALAAVLIFSHSAGAEPPSGPKVGLALSGGAAWGLAHIGVLEVLEAEGIAVDMIAGTSAGALIGALAAGGYAAGEIASIAGEMTWSKLAGIELGEAGLFSTAKLEALIDEWLGGRAIEELDIAFAAVATDLDTGEEVVLDEGPVGLAVRASAAFPVVFAPVRHGERRLVDGGLVNNLPTTVVRRLGADVVIAVDVASTWRYDESPKSLLDLAFRTHSILMERQFANGSVEAADVVIRPDLTGTGPTSLSDRERLIERGREAARKMLPEIRRVLGEAGASPP